MTTKPLTSTARLQFHNGFTLADGAALVPYLAQLGISHLYASPIFKARAGSTHGYDIVDHNQINPELGGIDALREMVAALRAHDMGLILDIVPNHMGVGGADNALWMDVLEWGRASAYAEFFDIDWDPPDATLRGRMLAPFLGDAYGTVLADNQLKLRFDPADGRLFVDYYGNRFPINPRDYAAILLSEGGPLETVAREFNDLPVDRDEMRAAAEAARAELRRPEYAQPGFAPKLDTCASAALCVRTAAVSAATSSCDAVAQAANPRTAATERIVRMSGRTLHPDVTEKCLDWGPIGPRGPKPTTFTIPTGYAATNREGRRRGGDAWCSAFLRTCCGRARSRRTLRRPS